MKNVTVTLTEEVAAWARVWAAKHNTSVSQMLGQFLAERMQGENRYDAAMAEFLGRKAQRLRTKRTRYPTREQLHAR